MLVIVPFPSLLFSGDGGVGKGKGHNEEKNSVFIAFKSS